MGKGGTNTTSTVTQQNIPEEFYPYFERLLTRSESESLQPYQPYAGERLAGPSADTESAYSAVRDVAFRNTPGQDLASNVAASNVAQAGQMIGGSAPYQFSQYRGFMPGQAVGYGGIEETQVDPYAGFGTAIGDQYTGFEAASASPYAGFEQTTASPYADFNEAQYNEFQFAPTEQFTGESVSQYMNPYMQQVVDVQKKQAQKDYDIARQARSARAVEAGAFGGSRQAVQESLAEKDLLERQGALEATGLSSAYTDAQRMFEADRAARASAEQARAGEAARVQTGLASEASRVQAARAAELARIQMVQQDEAARVQAAQAAELARTQGIGIDEAARVQAAQAAEAARIQDMTQEEFSRVQTAQAQELARVQGISVEEAARRQQMEAAEIARVQGISIDEAARVQAARASELARIQAAQASENRAAMQDRLAMMGFSAEQAQMVADLEQQARTGDIQAAQLLEGIGKSAEARTQAGLDLAYEDYLRQTGYNQSQLGFMSNILQGLPIQKTGEQVQLTPYNPIQQALGAGLAGLSLYKGFQA